MRRKRAIIGSSIVVFLLITAVVIEAIVSGRFNPPAVVPVQAAPAQSQEEKVIIVEREIPAPTPSPSPTPAPESTATSPPKTEKQENEVVQNKPQKQEVQQKQEPQKEPQTESPTPVPKTPKPERPKDAPPPYERPEVIEEPVPEPEPEPEPEITSITLDSYDIQILTGDSWRLNLVSAPSSVTSQGPKWVTSNSAVADISPDLSGVTIHGNSAGTATITIYSKDGQYSASCTVTVS